MCDVLLWNVECLPTVFTRHENMVLHHHVDPYEGFAAEQDLNEEIMVRSHLIDLSQTTHAVRPGLAFLTKYSDLKENNSIRNQIT